MTPADDWHQMPKKKKNIVCHLWFLTVLCIEQSEGKGVLERAVTCLKKHSSEHHLPKGSILILPSMLLSTVELTLFTVVIKFVDIKTSL